MKALQLEHLPQPEVMPLPVKEDYLVALISIPLNFFNESCVSSLSSLQ